jgi:antitoxin (DNA-binding transcriptional repressor) of toxin-antitoxin stability system
MWLLLFSTPTAETVERAERGHRHRIPGKAFPVARVFSHQDRNTSVRRRVSEKIGKASLFCPSKSVIKERQGEAPCITL